MDVTRKKQEMPRLPRMKFQGKPCKRFELEEGDHNPATLRARQLVDRLQAPARQEVIQDLDTSLQNCSWWVFLEDWADSWAGCIGGSRAKVFAHAEPASLSPQKTEHCCQYLFFVSGACGCLELQLTGAARCTASQKLTAEEVVPDHLHI